MLIFSLTLEAVEHERVGAVLGPRRHRCRRPGFQTKRIVAGAELRRVVAATADDDVIAIATDQRVVAVAADDGVVARAAVDGELDETGEAVPGRDGVVAAISIHDEVLGGADVEEEGRRGLTRSKRTREPLAVIVNVSEALPPLTLGGVRARRRPRKGRCRRRGSRSCGRLPASPNTWSSPVPADQRVVAGAAEQQVVARLYRGGCRCRRRRTADPRPKPPVSVVVAGSAEQFGRRAARRWTRRAQSYRLPPLAEHLDRGRVGDGGLTAIDGHGGRRSRKVVQPASRLVTMVLSTPSPSSESNPAVGKKVALIAMAWSSRYAR